MSSIVDLQICPAPRGCGFASTPPPALGRRRLAVGRIAPSHSCKRCIVLASCWPVFSVHASLTVQLWRTRPRQRRPPGARRLRGVQLSSAPCLLHCVPSVLHGWPLHAVTEAPPRGLEGCVPRCVAHSSCGPPQCLCSLLTGLVGALRPVRPSWGRQGCRLPAILAAVGRPRCSLGSCRLPAERHAQACDRQRQLPAGRPAGAAACTNVCRLCPAAASLLTNVRCTPLQYGGP